eukprot:403335387
MSSESEISTEQKEDSEYENKPKIVKKTKKIKKSLKVKSSASKVSPKIKSKVIVKKKGKVQIQNKKIKQKVNSNIKATPKQKLKETALKQKIKSKKKQLLNKIVKLEEEEKSIVDLTDEKDESYSIQKVTKKQKAKQKVKIIEATELKKKNLKQSKLKKKLKKNSLLQRKNLATKVENDTKDKCKQIKVPKTKIIKKKKLRIKKKKKAKTIKTQVLIKQEEEDKVSEKQNNSVKNIKIEKSNQSQESSEQNNLESLVKTESQENESQEEVQIKPKVVRAAAKQKINCSVLPSLKIDVDKKELIQEELMTQVTSIDQSKVPIKVEETIEEQLKKLKSTIVGMKRAKKKKTLRLNPLSQNGILNFQTTQQNQQQILKSKLKNKIRSKLKTLGKRFSNNSRSSKARGNFGDSDSQSSDQQNQKAKFKSKYIEATGMTTTSSSEDNFEELYCDICHNGKVYTSQAALKKHRHNHEAKDTWPCDYPGCNANFQDRNKLKRHSIVHTGEKPYVCEICGKRFGLEYNMFIHQRIHTGEKPFQCKYPGCFRGFNQKSNLAAHDKTHHNNAGNPNNLVNKSNSYYYQRKQKIQGDLNSNYGSASDSQNSNQFQIIRQNYREDPLKHYRGLLIQNPKKVIFKITKVFRDEQGNEIVQEKCAQENQKNILDNIPEKNNSSSTTANLQIEVQEISKKENFLQMLSSFQMINKMKRFQEDDLEMQFISNKVDFDQSYVQPNFDRLIRKIQEKNTNIFQYQMLQYKNDKRAQKFQEMSKRLLDQQNDKLSSIPLIKVE